MNIPKILTNAYNFRNKIDMNLKQMNLDSLY